MKVIFILGLLIASAAGQNPPPVLIETQVSFLSVSFVGESEGHSRFRITNTSEHAVTAVALFLLPGGSQPLDGRYSCDGQCIRIFGIADNLRPIIPAKGAVERRFDIPPDGGVLVAEAAILDDESWAGDERVAAFMVATQFGNQTEYDRIIAAVNLSLAGGPDDAQRILQIRSRLGSLPTGLEVDQIRSFNRWFPGLPDCTQRYARAMKRASAREKQVAVDSIEQFAHGAAPGSPSLAQWWEKTKQQLAAFGCAGCAEKAAYPKPPSQQAAFPACEADSLPEVLIPVYYLDDGSEEDVDTGTGDAELAAEDTPALNQYAPRPVSPKAVTPQPEPDATPVEESHPAPSVPVPQPNTLIGMPPSGVSLIPQPDGRSWRLWRAALYQPAPDDVVYQVFFREIAALGDLALHDDVLWEQGKEFHYRDAAADGLSPAGIEILKNTAVRCNGLLVEMGAKRSSLYFDSLQGYPRDWFFYAPPRADVETLSRKEIAVMNLHLAQLRAKLGTPAFSALTVFVRRLYHSEPGPRNPLSDEEIYSRFFHYVATLNQLSPETPAAVRETFRRVQALRAIGFSEKDWGILRQVSLEYNPDFIAIVSGKAPARGIAAQPASAVPGPMVPSRESNSSGAAPSPAGPVNLASAQDEELQREGMRKLRSLSTHIEHLRSGLGEADFHKLDIYLHRLYSMAGMGPYLTFSSGVAVHP